MVAPLRGLGTPTTDIVGPMPYPAMFALTAEAEVRGLQHHLRSLFLETVDEGALQALVERSAAVMSAETLVQVRILGGAMARVPAEATSFARRDKALMVMVTNYGSADAPEAASRAERTEQVWHALHGHALASQRFGLQASGKRPAHRLHYSVLCVGIE